jgi:hypothetical protein
MSNQKNKHLQIFTKKKKKKQYSRRRNANSYKISAPKQRHTPNTTDNNINGSCSITGLVHISKLIISTSKGKFNFTSLHVHKFCYYP